MTLGEHLNELRRRVIRSLAVFAVACLALWAVSAPLVNLLQRPVLDALARAGYPEASLQFTTVTMAFLTRLSVALVAAALVSAPWAIIEFWLFISAGLYLRERRSIRFYAPISISLFIIGVLFAYFILLPLALAFLLKLGAAVTHTQPHLIVKDYISLIIRLALGVGVSFQLPIVMTFFARTRIVPAQTFRRNRRHAILAAFILGALFTPPDPGTQILLAIPLILLYELGLILSGAYAKETSLVP